MKPYTSRKREDELFDLIGPDGKIIQNHNGKSYPPLSENISRNLTHDLNDISEWHENRKLLESGQKVQADLVDQLKESFSYCLISSLMEYEEHKTDAELGVELPIQWDRLFRLNHVKNGGQLEYDATKKARDYFQDKWMNFGLNYSQDIEEMEQNGVQMVSEEIVSEVINLLDTMHISKKIAVDILYNFFGYFSISIPILWVTGNINDDDFIASYYALEHSTAIDELDEESFDEPRFLMNRLLFLKTIIWGYAWNDPSLPCSRHAT